MKIIIRVTAALAIIVTAGNAYSQEILEYVSSSLFHDYFRSVVRSGNYIYCGGENGIQIFSMLEPDSLVFVGNVSDAIVYNVVDSKDNPDSLLFSYGGTLMQIFDISDGADPVLIGQYDADYDYIVNLMVEGTVAYIVAESVTVWYQSYIQTVDISDPQSPFPLDYATAAISNVGLEVDSGFIYILNSFDLSFNNMQIFGTDNSGQIYHLCDYDFGYYMPSAIAVSGDYAYVGFGGVMQVFDIEDRTNPILEVSHNIGSFYLDVQDNDLYTSSGTEIVRWNINNPTGPVQQSGLYGLHNIEDFHVSDDTLIVISANENYNTSLLHAIEYSDPHYPVIEGIYNVPGEVRGLELQGNTALIANGYSGIRAIDITDPYNPIVYENIETGGDAVDIAISGNYAYLASYYAGLLIYDITDPENPIFAGSFVTTNITRFVEVEGDYAYLINTIEGVNDLDIVILNVYDPYNPVFIRVFSDLYWPRYLDVVDTIAYISCLYSLEIVNMADPSAPVHLASHPYRYTGNNLFVEGNYAYVAGSPHGLDIFDISNPENPYIIGYFDSLPAVAVGVNNGYACLSGYFDLYLLDVSDPTNPVFIDEYADVKSRNTIYMREQYLYVPTEEYFLILKMAPTGFEFAESVIPSSVSLSQNYPNPFNAQTTIRFVLPKAQDVELAVYDLLGRQIDMLIDEYLEAGAHNVNFDASSLSSGVYFYRLQAGEMVETRRMVLLK
ncbi:MAG: T9SS type A sorting domain-containing protein [Candidatus Zixiibacteriota bacterium]|nr:MAG: T9SS type A sorting domain-containing protein [candidate division Zixibacteria bacterium]